MKKLSCLALLAALLATTLNAAEIPLLAGQDWEVGTVYVSNDADNLYVQLVLDEAIVADGWCLTETHVQTGVSLDDFPLNKVGNPKIGHFEICTGYDCAAVSDIYTIPLPVGTEIGDLLLVAAHASIEKEVCVEVNGDLDCTIYMESAWGDGTRFNEKGNWATYFSYEVAGPCVLTLDITGVNDGAFQHQFIFLTYDGVEVIDATGAYMGDGAPPVYVHDEFLSDVVLDLGAGTISFTSLYDRPDNYTWYPAFTLEDDNTLTFVDVNDPDNVYAAFGTWTLNCD